MLDSIYHMTLKLLKNHIFGFKILALLCSIKMDVIMIGYQISKPLVVYRFYCMALYHSQTSCHKYSFSLEKILEPAHMTMELISLVIRGSRGACAMVLPHQSLCYLIGKY